MSGAGDARAPAPVTSEDCPYLHVDMDAFYAAVMTRDRPELRDRPVVVGGGDRGVVLSASYAARTSGVRSGIPMTRARRLCPTALVIRPDYDLFTTVSISVMEIFRRVTPAVEALSLDEAFLDVSGASRRLGGPVDVAELIRARVADEQGIACSVGVAGTVGVAKIASRRAKPDGVVVVPPDQVTSFLHPLAVTELWGVGPKTGEQLHRLGLHTVGDLAHTPRPTLQRALGQALGLQLHRYAWGEDSRMVVARRHDAEGPDKSIGSDETFGRDTDDPEVVLRELLHLTVGVAARLRAAAVAGRTVTIKVRFADFTTITRSRTRPEPTDVTGEIYETAVALFRGLGLQRARIRLVGVRVEGLQPRAQVFRQLVLGERDQGWSEADQAVDRAVSRFGARAVQPASLLGRRVPRSG
ncbi:DNA polymerase IV [Nocardioides sp. HDW12B]|uniref:DNA polymerase IV n=1 Tax=Nocardioides sp. HDW12B TaxID=2714939 RepID=UPI0014084576|nr:DNA polymerase IV [Nocardioides sp. HDW12B]QIK66904.1 DNA polymerase IV [Nocardioides sp. HDW12B]